jgi:hypothetical protein
LDLLMASQSPPLTILVDIPQQASESLVAIQSGVDILGHTTPADELWTPGSCPAPSAISACSPTADAVPRSNAAASLLSTPLFVASDMSAFGL